MCLLDDKEAKEAEPLVLALSSVQAAQALGIGLRTLFNLTAPRGPIPVVKAGRRKLYSADALRRWLAAAEVTPTRDD